MEGMPTLTGRRVPNSEPGGVVERGKPAAITAVTYTKQDRAVVVNKSEHFRVTDPVGLSPYPVTKSRRYVIEVPPRLVRLPRQPQTLRESYVQARLIALLSLQGVLQLLVRPSGRFPLA